MLISVCMCTYKRVHLERTLNSIEALNLPENATIEIIVVDNDEAQSGRTIFDRHAARSRFPCRYILETRKNISIARNAYLTAAKGSWIASIDDDEVADKNWLLYLLDTAKRYDSQVVFGSVKPVFPDSVPNWIEAGKYFVRKDYKTGTSLTSGGAGCTITNVKVLREHSLSFNKVYGLSGGEDAELFHRIYNLGYKLSYCKEAFVEETVEPHRLNSNFLTKRAFRVGQSFTSYRLPNTSTWINKVKYFTPLIPKAIFASILCMITFPLGKHRYFKYWLKLCDIAGKVSVLFGNQTIELYK